MASRPTFRRGTDGKLLWKPSKEAEQSEPVSTGPARSACAVERAAMLAIRMAGRSTEDNLLVLGQYCLQFGKYQGRTFQWLLENALGYAGWVVCDLTHNAERMSDAPLSRNKFKLLVR